MTSNLRRAVGNLLVVGVSGTELTGLERAFIKLVRPAGIILFKRSIADAVQTHSLLAEATSFCAPNALRCVDLEGGSVDRLHDALAPMPAAQAVYRAAQNSGKPGLMREQGELVARAVKAFGFNISLAPVLDLGLPSSAEVMGSRVVSPDPNNVVTYARAFLSGLAAQRVAGCGKHFPGLGGGTLDSHLETPAILRTPAQLNAEDLVPWRELRAELPMIMVSHAAFPLTPGRNRPASVSPYWITTVLRNRIGYRGLIFSDDLEMGGVLKFLPIEGAAIEAIRAGMDLVEICHSPELILRAFEALLQEAERSASFRKLLLTRVAQASLKRKKLFTAKPSPALLTSQFEALRSKVLRFGEIIAASQPAPGATQA